jgi:hypothetical protein
MPITKDFAHILSDVLLTDLYGEEFWEGDYGKHLSHSLTMCVMTDTAANILEPKMS